MFSVASSDPQNSYVLAKDFIELKLLVEEIRKTGFKEVKLERGAKEITIAVQLLIFHYLNFLPQLATDNKGKAVILSALFKADGTENIRKALSNVGGRNSKFMTEKNLVEVRDFFAKARLVEALEKVTKDLEKLVARQA